jgi:serine/threonine-protein kinase
VIEVDQAPPPPPSAPRVSSEEMEPPVADPLLGLVIAERYRIIEELGRGGMGIVYKVEHTRLGKLLAMKLLTGELARNPDVVRRFKQEALTVSKLSSANTVQVFDFGVAEGGLTYLVMELVAGEDLGRVLRRTGPLAFDRLGKLIVQVCTSLAEAHQKSIVHRDMKPENIMLLRGRDGAEAAKVLDFGLAKIREGAELNDVTSEGAIVGTPFTWTPRRT